MKNKVIKWNEDKNAIVIPSFIERNMLKSMTPNFG